MERKLLVLSGPWLILGLCRLSVRESCTSHCPCLFFCLVVWRKKERSRIRAVQMDNLRVLLFIRRMDRMPSTQLTEWWGVMKKVGERTGEEGG